MNERLRAVRRGRPAAHRAAHRDALPRRARRLDSTTRCARLDAAQREGRALSIGLLGNAAEVLPELVRRGVDGRRRDRPDERPRPAQRLRPGRADASSRPTCCAPRDPDDYLRRVGESVLAHVDAIRDAAGAPAPRRSTTATRCAALAAGARRRGRVRLPRLRPRLHPAAVLRGQGPVPLGRAVRRPGRHRRDRRRDPRPVRRPGAHPRAGSSWRASGSQFQGLPARICWLGYGERAPGRAALQRAGRHRRGARRRS